MKLPADKVIILGTMAMGMEVARRISDDAVIVIANEKNKAFEPEPMKITAIKPFEYIEQTPISGQEARRERRKKNRKK